MTRRLPVLAVALAGACGAALALPATDAAHVRAVTEGWLLGGYAFTRYKSATGPEGPGEVVVLSDAARASALREAFETAQVVAGAVARTRDWVNTPPGDLTPPTFAEEVVEDRERRERLARRARMRSQRRHIEKTHKAGSMRFALLVLTLVATAVVVTIAMFQTLYIVMG